MQGMDLPNFDWTPLEKLTKAQERVDGFVYPIRAANDDLRWTRIFVILL